MESNDESDIQQREGPNIIKDSDYDHSVDDNVIETWKKKLQILH